jgi:hypothetical protein
VAPFRRKRLGIEPFVLGARSEMSFLARFSHSLENKKKPEDVYPQAFDVRSSGRVSACFIRFNENLSAAALSVYIFRKLLHFSVCRL